MTMHLIASCHVPAQAAESLLGAMIFESPLALVFVYPPERDQPCWTAFAYCRGSKGWQAFSGMADALDYVAGLLVRGF